MQLNYSDIENFVKFYKKKLRISGKIYLFIDEIQNITSWEHFVNSYSQNFVDEYEIFISGSNSTMLSGELATMLNKKYRFFARYYSALQHKRTEIAGRCFCVFGK